MQDLKGYLKGLLLYTIVILLLIITSCQKEDLGSSPCINGNCYTELYPDPVSQPNAFKDDNGYWHLQYEGAKYASIIVKYALTKQMNAANQPWIKTEYTTDTWLVAKDGYRMWSSRYNPLGSDYTQNFQMAIADTMVVVTIPKSEVQEMNNMSGQYYRDCYNPSCGLGPKPKIQPGLSHRSKALLTYFPEQALVHDTVQVFFKSTFRPEGEEGVVVRDTINIIL